jgi:lipopolysaccharide/colanic/teichoic acid biosynthesis glycosyltransferase
MAVQSDGCSVAPAKDGTETCLPALRWPGEGPWGCPIASIELRQDAAEGESAVTRREGAQAAAPSLSSPMDRVAKRLVDVLVAGGLLIVLAPLIGLVAIAIRLESSGPAFYRCRRIGLAGAEFAMLKFRKMVDGATGPPLRASRDERFTRLGRFLAASRLDEIPQLWNVLKGQMTLVGPRPEDPRFVQLRPGAFEAIIRLKPGVTGLSQLAFANESDILDPDDRMRDYLRRILPQKLAIDHLYATSWSLWLDLKILGWTLVAVLPRLQVAVHRGTGAIGLRRRPAHAPAFEHGGA